MANGPSNTHAPNKPKALVLIGKPATGKGTQGEILGAIPGFFYVSMGEVFRSMIEEDSCFDLELREVLENGELLPDSLVMEVFSKRLEQVKDSNKSTSIRDLVVLDGIPRTIDQAIALEKLVDVVLVFHLVVDDEQRLLRRMQDRSASKSRTDDREEVFRQRIEIYNKKTAPVLDHYQPSAIEELDGLETPFMIHYQIVKKLIPLVSGQESEKK